ncbi:hypothetical protein E5288_WYG002000 [Bos mutus]|uniref:Uncharacterized protein n=1 Tax=Bos mutus TaxID=72004 RepID=A0A6B0RSF6_9CETA|nr:hypothetical protein [Bos mutus]
MKSKLVPQLLFRAPITPPRTGDFLSDDIEYRVPLQWLLTWDAEFGDAAPVFSTPEVRLSRHATGPTELERTQGSCLLSRSHELGILAKKAMVSEIYAYFHIQQQLFNTFQLNMSSEDFLPLQTPRFRLTEQMQGKANIPHFLQRGDWKTKPSQTQTLQMWKIQLGTYYPRVKLIIQKSVYDKRQFTSEDLMANNQLVDVTINVQIRISDHEEHPYFQIDNS